MFKIADNHLQWIRYCYTKMVFSKEDKIMIKHLRELRGYKNSPLLPQSTHRTIVFRLDALALSVIATATWLGGWLAGCHTPVLYQNLSENFFDHLKAPSL